MTAGEVFGPDYADYYDFFYTDKDYEAECDLIEAIFQRFGDGNIRGILDLGCGTGGHAIPLANRGYKVTAVDRSEAMLGQARRKIETLAQRGLQNLDFIRGDIRPLNLGHTFDAVIAMFAVIGYQSTNADVLAPFKTARRHLRPKGLFIFDVWFGPAVITQRPINRFKEVYKGGNRVLRFANASLDLLAQTLRVDYTIIELNKNRVENEVKESHIVRFFFPQELKALLKIAGFQQRHLCSFMKLDRVASWHDWNVLVIAESI